MVYHHNWRQISNSGEGGKFSCTQNKNTCPDAHQVPTATVPIVIGFWGAIHFLFRVDQIGSISNSTEAVTDLCTFMQAGICCSWSCILAGIKIWKLYVFAICLTDAFSQIIFLQHAGLPLIWEDIVVSRVALSQTFPREHPASYLALQLVAVENNQSFIQKKPHTEINQVTLVNPDSLTWQWITTSLIR